METLIVFLIDILANLFFAALIIPMPFNDKGVVRYDSIPYVTVGLIVVNSLIFLTTRAPHWFDLVNAQPETFEMFEAQLRLYQQTWTYGARESFFRDGTSIGAFSAFSSMFMHADFNHLVGNMIFLWAFGKRVEDACGAWRYLAFYIFAGFIATIGTYAITTSPYDVPGIGASGAILGLLGAYVLLFPSARMGCLWVAAVILRVVFSNFSRLIGEKPPDFKWTIQIPALIVIAFYVGFDINNTFRSIDSGELQGGVNYVAHATGFLSAITIFLFVRKDLFTRYVAGRAL